MNLAFWRKKPVVILPGWVTVSERRTRDRKKPLLVLEVNPAVVYPLWLKILGYGDEDVTQAKLECARKCMTRYLWDLLDDGFIFKIRKDLRYRLVNYPPGSPINWRKEYERLKGENPPLLAELKKYEKVGR